VVAPIRILAVAATTVAAAAGCGSDEPDRSRITGFEADLRDVVAPARGELVQWRSSWRLRWNAAPGARGYLIYVGTSEGDSSKPKLRSEPRYGIEVANGVNARSRIRELRAEQLAFTAAQLTVSVAARYDGGKVGPRSAPFAVGEPVR
jgi:hypothetical protein